jgi:phosphatidylglycerol lysyltransferase
MRKRSDAMSGTMDLLLAQSLQQLRATGIIEASLGSAPLASVTQREGVLDHAVALLFEHFNRFYGYKSLFQFKKKFAPQWEGRYLVYPSGADLLRIFYALTRLHRSAGLGQFIMRRLSDATAFLGHHLYVFRLVQWVSSGSKHLES